MMKEMPITLKGTPQGILLTPQIEDWDAVLQGVRNALVDAAAFFRGGRVIVDMATRPITENQLLALRKLLDEHDIELWAVLTQEEHSTHIVRAHGIRTRLPKVVSRTETPSPELQGNAKFVDRTLRSGQRLDFPGHIVILGDVNPGAEIVAGGNIIVWGKVRGMVHAGAFGDKNTVVCALDLAPAQLRIAGFISRTPDARRRKLQPEVAFISENHIIARPWSARG